MSAVGATPYVGPRSLRRGEPLHGRQREVNALRNRLMAERVMLLYSPSGAGKTSLIQAGLTPMLEEYDFRTHTIVRLNEEPSTPGVNRFRYSMLRSLEQDRDRLGLSTATLEAMGLSDYLRLRLDGANAAPHVLVFDQFEEVMTIDRFDTPPKTEFLDDLGRALRSPGLWALFAIREEYLGIFDRYRDLLPNRLSSAFRIDLLGVEAARLAISRPARDGGRPFTPDAEQRLIDELTRRDDPGRGDVRSLYVEPVHLQVVCLRVWQQVVDGDRHSITAGDIRRAGGVEAALTDYYAKEVHRAAGRDDAITERQIRDWFGEQLLTHDDLRQPARTGPGGRERSAALDHLIATQLVRPQPRPEDSWYELSHDRLIRPVRTANEEWYEAHLSLLESRAREWVRTDLPPRLLLTAAELQAATAQLGDRAALTDNERRFLEESEEEVVRQRRARRLRWGLAATGVILLAVFAWLAWRAYRNAAVAQAQRLASEASTAEDPSLGLLLALEAVDRWPDDRVDVAALGALYRANAVSRLRAAMRGDDGKGLVARAVAANADGVLAILGADGTAYRTSDALDRDRLVPLFSAPGEPTVIAVSPGGRVAVAGATRLDIGDEPRHTGAQLDERAVDMAFMDDDRVAVVLADGTVVLHSVPTSKTVVLPLPTVTRVVALGPDRLVVGTDAGQVRHIDLSDTPMDSIGDVQGPMTDEGSTSVTAMAADARRERLAVAYADLSMRVISLVEPFDVTDLPPTSSPVSQLAFVGAPVDGDGEPPRETLAISTGDNVIRIADPESGTTLFDVGPTSGPIVSVAPLPGDVLIAAPSGEAAATVWDTEVGHGQGGPTRLVERGDGRLASAGTDGRVVLWRIDRDAATVVDDAVIDLPEAISDLAVSGARVAIAAGRSVALADGRGEPAVTEYGSPVRFVGFVPGTDTIVSAGDRALHVWDRRAGEADEIDVRFDAESIEFRMLASADPIPPASDTETIAGLEVLDGDALVLLPDGRVAVWDIAARRQRQETHTLSLGAGASATAMTVTPDASIVVGDSDGNVHLLDVADGGDATTFGDALSEVVAVAAGPSGAIAVAFGDRTLEVWQRDRAGRWELQLRVPPLAAVRDLAFVRDGDADLLAVATEDGRILVHPLELDVLRQVALEKVWRDLRQRECDRFGIVPCPVERSAG